MQVGAVLQAKRPVVAPPMPAPASKIVRRFTMISRSANTASVLSTQRLVPESPAAITSTLPAHSVTVVANPMRADAGKPVSDIGEVTLTCVQPSELSTEHDPTTATHTADSAVQANPLYLTVREGAELPDPNTEPVDNSVLGGGSRADPRRSTVGFAAMSSRQRGARRKRNIKGDGSTSTPSRPPTDPGLAVVTSLLSSPDISTDDMSAVCSTIPSAGDVSRDVRRQIRSAGAALLPALAQQLSVVQSRQTDERDAETTDTAMAYRAMASLSDHANARTLTNLSRGGLPEQLAQTLRDALEGTAASRAKAVAALPDALWLLSSVCRDRASADGFVNAGGVPLLLSVVKRHAGYASAAASSDDQRLLSPTRAADVALNGCVALAAIADHPGPASALLSGGSLPVLVASCFNPFRVSGMDSSCRPSSSLAEAACHVMLTLLGNAAPPWDPMALCNELCACDAIGSLWAVVYCALGHSDLISPDTSPATLDVSLAAQSLTLLLRILQCAHAVNTVASLAANDIKSLFVALPGAADKANVLHRLLARCNGRLLTGAASGALVDAEEEMALKQVVCQLLQHLPSPNSLSMSDESSTATLFPAEAASGIDNVLAARLINE